MTRTNGEEAWGRTPPTIYDVAQAAGVSPSTVSRALNKPGRVNAATEKRIREHASALGYQLNPMARAVITGRSDTIALVLSDVTNPVYFDLIRGAEHISASHSRTLVLAESQESPEVELAVTQRLRVAVDGIVLVGSRMHDDEIRSLTQSKPVIAVNRRVDGVASLVPDIDAGLGEALDHLRDLGHRAVGYLAGPETSWMNRSRWSVLFDGAISRGMSIVEIPASAPTLDGGRSSLRRVLAAGVSAVVAYNDLMALGLLTAAKEASVSVPGRLSIVGSDDIFGADLVTPSLTTIRSPLREIGSRAIEMLVAPRSEDEEEPMPATTFIRRESTDVPLESTSTW
ncbi:LacI family DNA-binding transcriptional regulator [Microbacterium sp.]|uniref:LacI family DNA-binding transcriptional regulator n=1 Tax=Microbacterium sp. TaxID=51671 RepID=UPI0028123F9D|nr:LacI family DNA-binding transcriptional regulator [Microbacterium sp.]